MPSLKSFSNLSHELGWVLRFEGHKSINIITKKGDTVQPNRALKFLKSEYNITTVHVDKAFFSPPCTLGDETAKALSGFMGRSDFKTHYTLI